MSTSSGKSIGSATVSSSVFSPAKKTRERKQENGGGLDGVERSANETYVSDGPDDFFIHEFIPKVLSLSEADIHYAMENYVSENVQFIHPFLNLYGRQQYAKLFTSWSNAMRGRFHLSQCTTAWHPQSNPQLIESQQKESGKETAVKNGNGKGSEYVEGILFVDLAYEFLPFFSPDYHHVALRINVHMRRMKDGTWMMMRQEDFYTVPSLLAAFIPWRLGGALVFRVTHKVLDFSGLVFRHVTIPFFNTLHEKANALSEFIRKNWKISLPSRQPTSHANALKQQ